MTWGLLPRPPDFVIGGAEDPYLLRWYLLPRNRWVNVYLHKFLRSDDDRALHDHPWANCSIVLKGEYREIWWRDPDDRGPFMNRRRPGSIVFRKSTTPHRIVLDEDFCCEEIPCWTLFLTGPKVRDWGFWCPQGWVPWQRFTAPGDSSRVGLGCDQPTLEGP